ncbi:MAG: hypothetical protein KDC87_01660 [Planctomycetes bacterium]|nr:hypothetical protein [Planctomycetota bacterium]MCB9871066.1 hypothetical protein [Planctomycetota bacterium]
MASLRFTARVWLLVPLVPWLSGCQFFGWVVGNRDATLHGGFAWRSPAPSSVVGRGEGVPRVWLRVRGDSVDGARMRVLASRVRGLLVRQGWQVEDDRRVASLWVDLDVRYWGENPALDRGESVFAKLLRAHRPDYRNDDEPTGRPELTERWWLTPGAALLSITFSHSVEHALVVDVRIRQGEQSDDWAPLVAWARRIDLTAPEAATELTDQLLKAMEKLF